MKALRKAPLNIALGAALAAMAMPTIVSSSAINVTGYSPLPNISAFDANDAGDALTYDFFTTVNGITTAFSLTNTSERAIAVKVRFREQARSMDVWDTIIFLSPFDKWDFFVKASAANPMVPEVNVAGEESSCTMLWNGTRNDFPSIFRKSSFNTDGDLANGWATGRVTVGHVEVIGMADITDADVNVGSAGNPNWVNLGAATEAKDQLIPGTANVKGCDALLKAFATNPADAVVYTGEVQSDAPNALIGRFLLDGSATDALEAGSGATVYRDTFTQPFLVSQSTLLCSTSGNCTSTYAWDKDEQEHPHFGDILNLGVYSIDSALAAASLMGDWSNNKANDVGSDWIITFPTRYTYLNWADCNKETGNEWCSVTPPYKTDLVTPPAMVGNFNPWNAIAGTISISNPVQLGPVSASLVTPVPTKCLPVQLWGWDIDEHFSLSGVSPGLTWDMCHEVNVVSMGTCLTGTSGSCTEVDARDSVIQVNSGPYARKIIPFAATTFEGDPIKRGWADLWLGWHYGPLYNSNFAPLYSGATIADLFLVRNTIDPTQNNASMTSLSRFVNPQKD